MMFTKLTEIMINNNKNLQTEETFPILHLLSLYCGPAFSSDCRIYLYSVKIKPMLEIKTQK